MYQKWTEERSLPKTMFWKPLTQQNYGTKPDTNNRDWEIRWDIFLDNCSLGHPDTQSCKNLKDWYAVSSRLRDVAESDTTRMVDEWKPSSFGYRHLLQHTGLSGQPSMAKFFITIAFVSAFSMSVTFVESWRFRTEHKSSTGVGHNLRKPWHITCSLVMTMRTPFLLNFWRVLATQRSGGRIYHPKLEG